LDLRQRIPLIEQEIGTLGKTLLLKIK